MDEKSPVAAAAVRKLNQKSCSNNKATTKVRQFIVRSDSKTDRMQFTFLRILLCLRPALPGGKLRGEEQFWHQDSMRPDARFALPFLRLLVIMTQKGARKRKGQECIRHSYQEAIFQGD